MNKYKIGTVMLFMTQLMFSVQQKTTVYDQWLAFLKKAPIISDKHKPTKKETAASRLEDVLLQYIQTQYPYLSKMASKRLPMQPSILLNERPAQLFASIVSDTVINFTDYWCKDYFPKVITRGITYDNFRETVFKELGVFLKTEFNVFESKIKKFKGEVSKGPDVNDTPLHTTENQKSDKNYASPTQSSLNKINNKKTK